MTSFPISRILSPVDFSRRSEGAVRSARRLAAHFGAELILLHVVEPFHVDFAMLEPFDSTLRELSQANVERKRALLETFAAKDLNGFKVTRAIAEGDAATQILKHARKEQADLLVMPTQGHGRIRELLIGSVTARVLDDSERPVLTGTHLEHERAPNDWRFQDILCAVDLGARSECVLQWGTALSKEFGSRVTVLHVSSNPRSNVQLGRAIEAAGLQAEGVIAEGDPHKVVTAMAAERRSDLVIIGRGTATSTLGRLRAQAYGIVRQSPCPVLSV